MLDFQCFLNCLSNSQIEELIKDCGIVFNCSSVEDEQSNYSTGSTFFQTCSQTPNTLLEAYALSIFRQHTQGLSFDPNLSGCEWWTQMIDPDDDIGFHWDRDYGEEEESGRHVYPAFATVTYLTGLGGPTVIASKLGSSSSSCSGDTIEGDIPCVVLSAPLPGKHIRFSGNLLHGAPGDLFEDRDKSDSTDDDVNDVNCDQLDNSDCSDNYSGDGHNDQRSEDSGPDNSNPHMLRVTFLVNIWLDHIPSQSAPLNSTHLKWRDRLTLINGANNCSGCSDIDVLPSLQFNQQFVTSISSSNAMFHNISDILSTVDITPTSVIPGLITRKYKFTEGLSERRLRCQLSLPIYAQMRDWLQHCSTSQWTVARCIYLSYPPTIGLNHDINCDKSLVTLTDRGSSDEKSSLERTSRVEATVSSVKTGNNKHNRKQPNSRTASLIITRVMLACLPDTNNTDLEDEQDDNSDLAAGRLLVLSSNKRSKRS